MENNNLARVIMTEESIKDMMNFVLAFFKCKKHMIIKGMADEAKNASEYLKSKDLTPEDFKRTLEEMSGQPMPENDQFYIALVNEFNQQ